MHNHLRVPEAGREVKNKLSSPAATQQLPREDALL